MGVKLISELLLGQVFCFLVRDSELLGQIVSHFLISKKILCVIQNSENKSGQPTKGDFKSLNLVQTVTNVPINMKECQIKYSYWEALTKGIEKLSKVEKLCDGGT